MCLRDMCSLSSMLPMQKYLRMKKKRILFCRCAYSDGACANLNTESQAQQQHGHTEFIRS
jgi:hypothetical protein